jgi:DNA-nicking Smr family endonuclease
MRDRHPGWLTQDDIRVWQDVVSTTRPLKGGRKPLGKTVPAFVADVHGSSAATSGQESAMGRPEREAQRATAPQAQLTVLDRRFVRRLRQGTTAPGATIDLHGLRQDDAYRRLLAFLHRCQTEGTKAAIVITGKGGSGDALSGERGVLRRAVPLWLALPELRSLVIGFQEAGPGLGGAGALIVRIRAGRPPASRQAST